MRKFILILTITFATIVGSTSCKTSPSDYVINKSYGTMTKLEGCESYEVWYDKETGCMYFTRMTPNGVAIVQLTDIEGNPKLYRQ